MNQTSAARHWRGRIEERTTRRLRELRARELWDGVPPVPIDHVAEHLLDLQYSWEEIDEPEGEEVLGCLRPTTREIVLNERRHDRLDHLGCLRFTIGHECGHADLYALADLATSQSVFAIETASTYQPRHRSSMKGDLSLLVTRLNAALRTATRERRREVYQQIHDHDRARVEHGADTAIEAAAVNHYSSAILMPADLLRAAARGRDLTQWDTMRDLAAQFEVSKEALGIRLQWLRLIHGTENGRVLLADPALRAQVDLF